MGNIFNEEDKDEIIRRIDELHPNSKPMWGKMNVSQMLAHCLVPTKISAGEIEAQANIAWKNFWQNSKEANAFCAADEKRFTYRTSFYYQTHT